MLKLTELTSSFRTKLMIIAYAKWTNKGETALDIGCGTGVAGKYLMDQLSLKVTGCDVKNYLVCKIPFLKIEGGKLPVKNKSYDVAFLNDVLHHINRETQISILKEALRVAKKVLIFEAEPTFTGKLTDIILNKYHYGDLNTPLTFRSLNDWKNIFKKLSLKSMSIKLNRPLLYPFSHIAFMVTGGKN